MGKRSILAGYKRINKRYVPPMMQLPNLRQQSYINDILPELLWIGLINDRTNFAYGARLFREIILSANQANKNNEYRNFAICSQFENLTTDEKNRFLEELSNKKILEEIRSLLSTLMITHPSFPLSFLGVPSLPPSVSDAVKILEECVGKHLDKNEIPSIALHVSLVYSRMISGKIHFAKKIDLDLNSIFDDPESEKAKRSAALVRANSLNEFGHLGNNSNWPKNFWNTNLNISPCRLPNE